MDHFEMVEKLRTKANVTYEEAKEALEKTNWDLLDAMVLLENEGKVQDAPGGREYTTQEKKFNMEVKPEVKEGFGKLWQWIKGLLHRGNTNQFVITRHGEELIAMPISVLVLLMICFWPFSIAVMFVGLFLGARYSFRGPNINKTGERVNDALNRAAEKAESADPHDPWGNGGGQK